MKFLKAIGLGALLWVLIFVEISIFQVGLKLTNTIGYLIHYVLLIPMAILAAWLYYRKKDKINGFLLGLFFIIVSIILDLAITVPLFIEGDYTGFFGSLYLWIGIIESVLIVGIYDLARKK